MTLHDDGPNEELKAKLRETMPDPPQDAVDWAALHGRIMMQSAPLLAGNRTTGRAVRPSVWQTLSGWSGRGSPLAAAFAAAAALVLLLGYAPDRPVAGVAGVAGVAAALPTVEDALADGLVGGSAPLLIAGSTDEELLAALVFYDEGERR